MHVRYQSKTPLSASRPFVRHARISKPSERLADCFNTWVDCLMALTFLRSDDKGQMTHVIWLYYSLWVNDHRGSTLEKHKMHGSVEIHAFRLFFRQFFHFLSLQIALSHLRQSIVFAHQTLKTLKSHAMHPAFIAWMFNYNPHLYTCQVHKTSIHRSFFSHLLF